MTNSLVAKALAASALSRWPLPLQIDLCQYHPQATDPQQRRGSLMELVTRMMDGSISCHATDPSSPSILSEPRLEQDQKIAYLRRVPILENCTNSELREIARLTDVRETPAGELLLQAGERGDRFFFIVDGAARVEVSPHIHHRVGPGEFFGEMSLLDGEPRSATVIADSAVRLLIIHHRDFATLLEQVPALTRRILVTLCQRLRRTEKALNE